MKKEYLKYFATYKGPETPFLELCKSIEKEFGVIYITRQPTIKTIGFYSNSKEKVKKLSKLEQIVEVECFGVKK